MRVMNWVQNRRHGGQCRKTAPEFSAGSVQPVADTCSEPRRQRREDELQGGWPAAEAVLSMGSFGEGHLEELKKLQEELTLLMRAKGTEEDDDTVRHLPLKRSLSEGIAKKRPVRKLVSSVFHGFLPRPSSRETTHESRATENPWLSINEGTHPGNPMPSKAVIKSDPKAQMHWRGNVYGEDDEQGSKWIQTDSEYIVLEI